MSGCASPARMSNIRIEPESRRDFWLHLGILIGGAALYLIVRVVIAPTTGWLRFHVTDFLAGMMLPSLFALWPNPPQAVTQLISSLGGKLILVLSAVLIWEVAHPLLSDNSTADWRDVLAYLLGVPVQHLITSIGRMSSIS